MVKILIVLKDNYEGIGEILKMPNQENLRIFDCSQLLKSQGASIFLSRYDHHCNQKGCSIIAKLIYQYLKNTFLK